MLRPFRAYVDVLIPTQGVALGWYVMPFQGPIGAISFSLNIIFSTFI